jgi:hypothetical protein
VDSDAISKLLITCSVFVKKKKKKWEHNKAVHQLFIDFTKAYNSVRRETLYNILIEFGIPKELVRLIKICLKLTADSGWLRTCLRCFLLGKF